VKNIFAREDTKSNEGNNESMEKRFKEKHFFVVRCFKLLPYNGSSKTLNSIAKCIPSTRNEIIKTKLCVYKQP
jgi:hypothetical protein